MKLGLIVECATGGMESTVLPKILKLLEGVARIPITPVIKPMTNKKQLILRGADAARILLSTGCNRVVMIWDENPPWTPGEDFAADRCWHVEREQVLTNLASAGIDRQKVGMVCIEREFETWLLHDSQLVRAVLERGSRRVRMQLPKDPATIDRPKAFLSQLLSSRFGRRFNREVSARNFEKHLTGLEQLKRCGTFRYFVQNVLGHMPQGWKPYEYEPKGPPR